MTGFNISYGYMGFSWRMMLIQLIPLAIFYFSKYINDENYDAQASAGVDNFVSMFSCFNT